MMPKVDLYSSTQNSTTTQSQQTDGKLACHMHTQVVLAVIYTSTVYYSTL